MARQWKLLLWSSSSKRLVGTAIDAGVRGQRRDDARKAGPDFRRVGKRMGAGKILDIGCSEAGRRVVEMNGAFEAELAGPLRETGGRDMIAVVIPRQGQLTRLGGDYELRVEHLLVVTTTKRATFNLRFGATLSWGVRTTMQDNENRPRGFFQSAAGRATFLGMAIIVLLIFAVSYLC
jgi:hypothetical protein